jgi:hypothetical protein
MNNPFDDLAPYECRNLIGHLQDAGRAEDVHRVLAMETVERGNAWFELCERRGEVRGYLADVDRAWRLAERPAPQGQKRVQSGDCGLQVRYALLAATMSGRALNISGPLLVALVRNDLWSSDQAMAYLRQMPDPGMRALALQRLAAHLPQPAVREAIVLAGRGASQWQTDNALVGLLPRQAELGEAPAALKAALLIEDGPTCAKCLAGVLRHSSSALRAKAEQDARQVSNPERRALLLQAVWLNSSQRPPPEAVDVELSAVRSLERPDSRARALAAIAAYLGEHALRGTLHAILAGEDGWTSESIADLLPRLAELGHPREALALIGKVRGDQQKARALTGIGPYLSAPSRAKALRTALNIESEQSKAATLQALVPLLDVRLLRRAAIAARPIRSATHRAQTLAAMGSRLPTSEANALFQEALGAIREQGGDYVRAFYLGTIAPLLPEQLRLEVLAEALDTVDKSPARQTVLFEVLPTLAPQLPKSLVRRALQITTRLADQPGFVEFLTELVPHLRPPLLDEAIGHILGVFESARDVVVYANGLVDLFQHLEEPRRSAYRKEAVAAARLVPSSEAKAALFGRLIESSPELMAELLETAGGLADERKTAEALVAALRRTSDDEKPSLSAQAFTAVLAIENQWTRAGVLARSATAFPADMSASLRARALKIAEGIQDRFMRVMALLEIAPELSDSDRQRALRTALNTARAIPNQQGKTGLFVMIAPKLAEFGMFTDAQNILDQIKEPNLRLRTIGGVRAWAAASAPPSQQENLFKQALDCLPHLEPNELAHAFTALAPRLPQSLLGAALTTAGTIGDRTLRKRALSGLAARTIEMLCPAVRTSWSRELHVLAGRARRDLWSDLAAAVPLLAACGATAKSARAAIDLSIWWP